MRKARNWRYRMHVDPSGPHVDRVIVADVEDGKPPAVIAEIKSALRGHPEPNGTAWRDEWDADEIGRKMAAAQTLIEVGRDLVDFVHDRWETLTDELRKDAEFAEMEDESDEVKQGYATFERLLSNLDKLVTYDYAAPDAFMRARREREAAAEGLGPVLRFVRIRSWGEFEAIGVFINGIEAGWIEAEHCDGQDWWRFKLSAPGRRDPEIMRLFEERKLDEVHSHATRHAAQAHVSNRLHDPVYAS